MPSVELFCLMIKAASEQNFRSMEEIGRAAVIEARYRKQNKVAKTIKDALEVAMSRCGLEDSFLI